MTTASATVPRGAGPPRSVGVPPYGLLARLARCGPAFLAMRRIVKGRVRTFHVSVLGVDRDPQRALEFPQLPQRQRSHEVG